MLINEYNILNIHSKDSSLRDAGQNPRLSAPQFNSSQFLKYHVFGLFLRNTFMWVILANS